MPKRKRCTRCQEKKPPTFEYFNKTKTGLRAECRQCATDRARQWRKDNPDLARARNTAAVRRWRKDHPEHYKVIRNRSKNKMRAAGRLHRQQMQVLPRDLTMAEWQETLRYFDHRCAYCRRRRKLQHEHVIPVCQGGGYTKDNIVPACSTCNYRKGARTPEEAGMPLRKPWPLPVSIRVTASHRDGSEADAARLDLVKRAS